MHTREQTAATSMQQEGREHFQLLLLLLLPGGPGHFSDALLPGLNRYCPWPLGTWGYQAWGSACLLFAEAGGPPRQ